MGSTFVSVKLAARQLKVSESSIRAYVKKGYLRASKKKNEVLLDDVLALEREREEAPPFDKTTFAKLWHAHQVLRAEVDVLKRMMNLKVDRLDLTDVELHNFYRLAQAHSEGGCPQEHEEAWAELLIRIQQEDLQKLESLTNDPDPWRPFYSLAGQLSLTAHRHLRSAFEACQHHLRELSGIWITAKGRLPSVLAAMPRHILAKMQKIH